MTNEERDQYIRRTHEKVCRMDERAEADRQLLTKIASTLYGNGKVGLCTKVYVLMLVLGGLGAVAVTALGALAVKVMAAG